MKYFALQAPFFAGGSVNKVEEQKLAIFKLDTYSGYLAQASDDPFFYHECGNFNLYYWNDYLLSSGFIWYRDQLLFEFKSDKSKELT